MIALHSVTNLVLCPSVCVSVFCDFHLGWSPAPGFVDSSLVDGCVVEQLSGRVGHPEVAHFFQAGAAAVFVLGCFGCV